MSNKSQKNIAQSHCFSFHGLIIPKKISKSFSKCEAERELK